MNLPLHSKALPEPMNLMVLMGYLNLIEINCANIGHNLAIIEPNKG
jgi:hypothetical protein